jgi:hypothetical protein
VTVDPELRRSKENISWCCGDLWRPQAPNLIPIFHWRGGMMQDLAIRELENLAKSKCFASKEKIIEVLKGILVIDLGGDTWRLENLFDFSVSGDIKCCVV